MRRIAQILAWLLLAGCATGANPATTLPATTAGIEPAATTSTIDEGFPVTVEADNGQVTIEEQPEAIVSLSPTATEMLFAIGAGSQVAAVDDQSDYPEEAPTTDLSGFTPNLEAILTYQPDLVVLSSEPADAPVSAGLAETGVPALVLDAAQTIEDVYRQIEVIGEATGHAGEAEELSQALRDEIEAIVTEVGPVGAGVTYYHELDPSLFTVTSSTFIGQVYDLLGMENIADAADAEGTGFPQLSSEYIVAEDPEMIFLADAEFGESAETLAGRPGWSGMTALEAGAVIELDSDIASRWGPRVVEFLKVIADAVRAHAPTS